MINSTIRKQWGKLIRGEKSLAPSLESLNTYYKISRQITQHEGGLKIYPLASFVSQLMDHFQPSKAAAQKFTLRDGKSFKEDVNTFITRALEVLQDAYLEPRERLWTLGILSWFKHNLAKSFCQELRDFREGDEVTRGEAELSLLSGQLGPLEIEVQRMWDSKTAPKNQEIQDMTLKEPLERIRMVRAFEIHRRDRYPNFVPSISFTKIYNDFLKLPVPLNVVESQKFVKKVLLAKGRYSAVEQDLVYHMWSRHLDIFQGHELRTRRIFSSQYDLSADCVNARCQFECFDPLEDNTPSIMEDVLGQVRKMSFHNIENVMEAGKKMSETSPEIGVKILNILLASSRLDPDAKVNVKKWIQTFDTCPLYLAQILKLISPDLVPNVLDEVHYEHQIFEFNHSLIPSARRVILEEMLVKKKIVAQETLDKYKYIEWANPPTKDSNLNELLDNLMAIFRSENMKEETSHKELLFEYIAQLLVHGYGAREHMRGLFEPKDIKDPGSEIQFFHEAVRNPSRISGIAPNDYLDVMEWAQR
ncbi:hypothetical protein DFH28DRAFT_900202 [Melampsora americana]|nr:hypothetical protein DFH28DRAFT_900202 [Melampsora americana]